MNPAISVIFLTTLIGAGQGLFLALYAAELGVLGAVPASELRGFLIAGSVLSLGLSGLGLFASFFHLGHPTRAWRAVAMWRTSWLSREVIVLPVFMAGVFAYGVAHVLGWSGSVPLGAVVALACIALFICTGMIYAAIRFLQEWASPLTLANYLLLGSASGFTLATALAAVAANGLVLRCASAATLLTLAAFVTRAASLRRNARLVPRSSVQTATGIKHPRIRQTAQGFMGGSFNTREFFHGRTPGVLRWVKWVFIALVFALPVVLLAAGTAAASHLLLVSAFAVQYVGLLVERWFFFAQANHPQNLYYQAIS
jgi:DMSO reductase anchor subunit